MKLGLEEYINFCYAIFNEENAVDIGLISVLLNPQQKGGVQF